MTQMLLVIMLAGRRAALPAVQVNAVVEAHPDWSVTAMS